jgi:peptidoglycan/LPS O-acetylase OafA/YrhL
MLYRKGRQAIAAEEATESYCLAGGVEMTAPGVGSGRCPGLTSPGRPRKGCAVWIRRARRLLPALFLLLAGVMTYASLFEAEALATLRVDVLAAVGYVTNWQLILDDQSYFESFEMPSMLRHLWSLAVEKQFYIAWPVIRVAGPHFGSKRSVDLLIVGIAASALAIALLHDPAATPPAFTTVRTLGNPACCAAPGWLSVSPSRPHSVAAGQMESTCRSRKSCVARRHCPLWV